MYCFTETVLFFSAIEKHYPCVIVRNQRGKPSWLVVSCPSRKGLTLNPLSSPLLSASSFSPTLTRVTGGDCVCCVYVCPVFIYLLELSFHYGLLNDVLPDLDACDETGRCSGGEGAEGFCGD